MTNNPINQGLRSEVERISKIRHALQKQLKIPSDMEGVEKQDVEDISKMLLGLECLLSKYQEKRDLCRMLECMRDVMSQAAEGVTEIDADIIEMSDVYEESCRRIQETRLGMHSKPNDADRDLVKRILAEASQ